MTAKIKNKDELLALSKKFSEERACFEKTIYVCGGTGCHAYGCEEVIKAFETEIKKQGLSKKVRLCKTGCHGFCEMGSLCVIKPSNIFYVRVKPENVTKIISETIKEGKVLQEFLCSDPITKAKIEKVGEVPFYKHQQRIIFSQNGNVDPKSIEDYIAIGGYQGLAKALLLPQQDIIKEIKLSGLRGRGGGGFLTGLKWEFCAKEKSNEKYIVCNADEGDPGAYMDRSVLEGNPNAVIEGMIIGARAIGANTGFVYVRNEYPLAIENLKVAIEQAKEKGFLGKNILGSGFDFEIIINRGGGAFVCGEETALISSLMGEIGEPHQKPPYPAQSGVYEKPTVINNVETWANVPMIMNKGSKWFSSIGTEKSKGTKIFSLVGKINNTGLVEVPMGISLRKIVFDIGGGIPKKRKFKAVQTGGPSGGCIPESHLDLPVDFDALTSAGSMMGSGGLIVMDDRTCMVDLARYFMGFLMEESCGKCTPCREGVKQMYKILQKICDGKGEEEDLVKLEELGKVVASSSLCGLGQTAPNPLLSTIKYFKDEYIAHIKNKRCPAGICKELTTYTISDKCVGCTACAKVCPTKAITGTPKKIHKLDQKKCVKCGACFDACKFDAVLVR